MRALTPGRGRDYFFFGPLFFIGSFACFGLSFPDFFLAIVPNLLSSKLASPSKPLVHHFADRSQQSRCASGTRGEPAGHKHHGCARPALPASSATGRTSSIWSTGMKRSCRLTVDGISDRSFTFFLGRMKVVMPAR